MSNIKVILIVDDDPDDIDLFCEALHEINPAIQCLSANSGDQAFELLQDGKTPRPDFILLDLNMPRMGGKVWLTKVKQLENLRQIPVIIYSTSRQEEEEVGRLGAAYFTAKPSSFHGICAMVKSILNMNWSISGETGDQRIREV